MVVLTQNIDGLHRAAGSSDVVELHGNLQRTKCFAACRGEPTLVELDTLPDPEAAPPGCPHCGAYLRPDVVWFSEPLPEAAMRRAYAAAAACDAMLVVGTSGVVYPAAHLPTVAKQASRPVIEVNVAPGGITPVADLFLQGPGGEVLPRLVQALRVAESG